GDMNVLVDSRRDGPLASEAELGCHVLGRAVQVVRATELHECGHAEPDDDAENQHHHGELQQRESSFVGVTHGLWPRSQRGWDEWFCGMQANRARRGVRRADPSGHGGAPRQKPPGYACIRCCDPNWPSSVLMRSTSLRGLNGLVM